MQADYDAVVPGPDNRPPPLLAEVGDLRLGNRRHGSVRETFDVRRYVWQVTYGGAEYIDLLRTYSPNIALDPGDVARVARGGSELASKPAKTHT